MQINIDIQKPIHWQFAEQMGLIEEEDYLNMPPAVGEGGGIRFLSFPGQLEFYHFGATRFRQLIEMHSVNAAESEWYLLHYNLSTIRQEKVIAGRTIEFQKHLPIGILLYGPDLVIETRIPPGVDSELASIRFHRDLLDAYFAPEDLPPLDQPLLCEDMDPGIDRAIQAALSAMADKISCHALILNLLKYSFQKLRTSGISTVKGMHPQDIAGVFRAASQLRDPLREQVPTVEQLAQLAQMGVTKFKTAFRNVFGQAPKAYFQKIRMEFARQAILQQGLKPSEVSELLGYAHPSNFTAAYKKYFGQLPSDPF